MASLYRMLLEVDKRWDVLGNLLKDVSSDARVLVSLLELVQES